MSERHYTVRTFGRDCFGNIAGYYVARGYGHLAAIAATFAGDLYVGSFVAAKAAADKLAESLNESANA